jgi:hypothetical protein
LVVNLEEFSIWLNQFWIYWSVRFCLTINFSCTEWTGCCW